MNNYLVISQSGDQGLNRQLANHIIDRLRVEHGSIVEYVNATEFEPKDYNYDKMIFIIPEWNGSFPYMFKQVIDNSEWPSKLNGKRILLIGTSNGKFGNVMGVNHFEYTLNYVGASINTKKVYIPKLTDNIKNDEYIGYLNDVLEEFHLTKC